MPTPGDPEVKDASTNLIAAIQQGSDTEVMATLEQMEGELSQEVIRAADQTKNLDLVVVVYDYALMNGITGDAGPNLLIWSLSEGLLTLAQVIAELANQVDLEERNSDGKSALDIAKQIGVTEIADQIREMMTMYGIETAE